jgi:hypothetical protein
MKKYIIVLVIIGLSFSNCKKENIFLIEKGKVGKLNKSTKINEIKSIFKSDSLVINLSKSVSNTDNKFFKDDDEYVVYNKQGKHLLTITPMKAHDSLATIKSIEVFSNQYKTKKGISLFSPFKEIQTAYQLSITNTLLSAHIDIDELNATMSIDKKDIGINEFNREKIKIEQIPDLAKINHFTIWFN